MTNTPHPPALDELLEVDPNSVTTVIDTDVLFEGRLQVKGNKTVLISGAVRGHIESEGAVIVNGGAEIVGSIKARSVQVAGTVRRDKQGDVIDVEGVLVLAKGAKVLCDARYGDLKAEHGVVIAGSISPRNLDVEDADIGGTSTVVSLPSAHAQH